jgi:phosphatidylinositol glycan class B
VAQVVSAPGNVDDHARARIWSKLHSLAVAALALRLAVAWGSVRTSHPDELFQYLEQAHRLVFGYGVVPWEFRFGARNWLLPGTLAVLLEGLRGIGLDRPTAYIPVIKSLFALLSVCLVYASYSIGRNMFCERTGRVAAAIAAIWYELLYVSSVATPEVLSAYAIVGALAVATGRASGPRATLVGLLLGASVALRLQYAVPAVALWGLVVMSWRWRYALRAALAGAAVLGFAGLLDGWSWGIPFISYYHYIDFNGLLDKAGVFGRSPWFAYAYWLAVGSVGLHLFAMGYGALQWRRCWPILVLVAGVLLPHSLLPHKEYRFIFLVVPLLLVVLADAIVNGSQRLRRIFADRAVLRTAIAAIATISLVDCVFRGVFARDDRLVATLELSRRSDVAAVLDLTGPWWRSGGFYYLHRDVPLYFQEQINGMPLSDLRFLVSHVLVPATQDQIPGFRVSARYRTVAILQQEAPPPAYRRLGKDGREPHQAGINDALRPQFRP